MASQHDHDADAVMPWDRPEAVRRDCLPHRGRLLHVLGAIARLLGIMSLLCVPLGLVSLPLGIVVSCCARRDLKEMDTGLMDCGGEALTAEALYFGQVGSFLGSIALVFWAFILAVANWG